MKLLATLVLTLSLPLAGCVGVSDLRGSKDAPAFYGATLRTAQEYTDCLVASWQAQGGKVARQPIQDGFEVSYEGSLAADGVLTAVTWNGRTDVALQLRQSQRGQSLIDSANLCM
jgi:hypothetical protein